MSAENWYVPSTSPRLKTVLSNGKVTPVPYLAINLSFETRSHYIVQVTLNSWVPTPLPFHPPETLGLSVHTTMLALPVAYFKSLMQSSIHLCEDIIVTVTSMAALMCAMEHIYLLITSWLVVRTHLE